MEELVCARIFFPHWPVVFFYCNGFAGNSFLKSSTLPPPLPPPQKSNGPPLRKNDPGNLWYLKYLLSNEFTGFTDVKMSNSMALLELA